jgi:MFS family permease
VSGVTAPLLTCRPGNRSLLDRRAAFALQASILVGLLAASSAPTPLYALYQSAWHFSALTVTVVFSAYALALFVALLTAGTLSDHLGRRPVLAGARLVEAAAMAAFAAAHGVTELIAARVVQGLATGAATGAAAAALLEFEHPRHPGRAALANSVTPAAGMAAGVLASTALVQYAPAPTHTVYLLLLGLFTAQAAAVTLTPETARPRPGAWRSTNRYGLTTAVSLYGTTAVLLALAALVTPALIRHRPASA